MNRLTDFKIKKIDLVGLAANKRTITLFKSQGDDVSKTKQIDIDKLPEDVRDVVKHLAMQAKAAELKLDDVPEDQREAVTALLKAAGVELEDPKDKKTSKSDPKGDPGDEDGLDEKVLDALRKALKIDEPDPLAGVDAKVAAMFKSVTDRMDATEKELKKAQDRAEAAEKKVADLEGRESRQKHIALAKSLDHIPGVNPDDFATTLATIEEKAGVEVLNTLVERLKSANAVMEESLIYTAFGRDNQLEPEADSPEALVMKHAKELMKADKDLTIEQARAAVYKSHPDLYQKIVAKERQRILKARGRVSVDAD